MRLTMSQFLMAVRDNGTGAREVLIGRGYHPNVIHYKAEKAARQGYTEYGVVVDRCWLTEKGRTFLSERVPW